jgi:hypothetical protein
MVYDFETDSAVKHPTIKKKVWSSEAVSLQVFNVFLVCAACPTRPILRDLIALMTGA